MKKNLDNLKKLIDYIRELNVPTKQLNIRINYTLKKLDFEDRSLPVIITTIEDVNKYLDSIKDKKKKIKEVFCTLYINDGLPNFFGIYNCNHEQAIKMINKEFEEHAINYDRDKKFKDIEKTKLEDLDNDLFRKDIR